jgi:hypothetical protein
MATDILGCVVRPFVKGSYWRSDRCLTFIVSQDGIGFEKNFGPQTAVIAPSIEQFDPGASWRPR